MRFVRLFVKLALGLGIGLALAGWLWYEGGLYWASRALVKDFYELKQAARGEVKATWEKQCREQNQSASLTPNQVAQGKAVRAVQLRFTSETEYRLEVLCRTEYGEPIVLKLGQIPFGVKKIRGSGASLPYTPGEIGLDNQSFSEEQLLALVVLRGRFGQERQVGLVADKVVNAKAVIADWSAELANAPETTCAGASGQCCGLSNQTGLGPVLNTSDCAGACYYQCAEKPTVVSFNTVPVMDRYRRELLIFGPKAEVEFGFKIVDSDGYVKEATVYFGDGERETLSGQEHVDKEATVNHQLAGQMRHTYICRQATCVYKVTIVAADDQDNELAANRLNTLTVIQTNQ